MGKVADALIKSVEAEPTVNLKWHADQLIADESLTEEDWKEAGLGATFRQTKEQTVTMTWADIIIYG